MYKWTVNDPSGSKLVSFDLNTMTFTFGSSDEIDLAGNDAIDYTITVTGINIGVTSAASVANTLVRSFVLRVKNPCLDPDFITIEEPMSYP